MTRFTDEEMASRIEYLLTEYYGTGNVYTGLEGNEVVFASPSVGVFRITVKAAKVLVADAEVERGTTTAGHPLSPDVACPDTDRR